MLDSLVTRAIVDQRLVLRPSKLAFPRLGSVTDCVVVSDSIAIDVPIDSDGRVDTLMIGRDLLQRCVDDGLAVEWIGCGLMNNVENPRKVEGHLQTYYTPNIEDVFPFVMWAIVFRICCYKQRVCW
jgi:hypothetical protein